MNNAGFEIERSLDQADYQTVGFVQGHGTKNAASSYNYVDESPPLGTPLSYRLKQIDFDGAFEYSQSVSLYILPAHVETLQANYPNPFNPETSISFDVPQGNHVSLTIHDIQGKLIASLINAELDAGLHKVTWNGTDHAGRKVASGTYLYRFEYNGQILTRAMLLLK